MPLKLRGNRFLKVTGVNDHMELVCYPYDFERRRWSKNVVFLDTESVLFGKSADVRLPTLDEYVGKVIALKDDTPVPRMTYKPSSLTGLSMSEDSFMQEAGLADS